MKLYNSPHIKIIRSLLSGYTMTRSLMDLEAENFILRGEVLDAGSKSTYASYYRGMDISKSNITFTDLNPKSDQILEVNFEKPLPINDQSYDTVVAMNILEHIYDHNLFVNEMARILKKNGELVGCVPFLIPYHADPNDYFRYTHTALRRILQKSDFKEIEIKKLGEGSLLCCSDLLYNYYPNNNRVMRRLRRFHYLGNVLRYILNLCLRRMKIEKTEDGGAYLALSFVAKK